MTLYWAYPSCPPDSIVEANGTGYWLSEPWAQTSSSGSRQDLPKIGFSHSTCMTQRSSRGKPIQVHTSNPCLEISLGAHEESRLMSRMIYRGLGLPEPGYLG
jgi:hypothetical protein